MHTESGSARNGSRSWCDVVDVGDDSDRADGSRQNLQRLQRLDLHSRPDYWKEANMKVRRFAVVVALPVVIGAMSVVQADSASAAPNGHASCAAQLTTDPMFGPPGPARVGGAVVNVVALGDRSDCVGVLLGVLGP
jgi:hypothetical protein